MRIASNYIKQIFIFVLLLVSTMAGAQTSLNVTNTTLMSNFMRPGIVMGTLAPYGSGQFLKSLNYTNHGYLESAYWQIAWQCTAGGTNDTTHWYSSSTNGVAYPVSFFVGANYVAMHQDGTSLGSGTITASSANTSTGMQFTLGTALSAPGTQGTNTANTDLLYVRLRTGTAALTTPPDTLSFLSGTTAWSSDVSPASNNQVQSLSITNGSVTFGIDQANTNRPDIVSTTAIVALNINGTYTLTYKAKCPGTSTSVGYSFSRIGGTNFISGSDALTCNATSGAGWTTFTHTFTGSEVGAQTTLAELVLNTTGTVFLQDMDIIESSTLAGNTTAYRDAVVRALQRINPGSIRFMQPPDWCTDVNDQIQPAGARRTCSLNPLERTAFGNTMGYTDELNLCLFLKTNCWITLGHFNQPSDWSQMVTWLSTQGYVSSFAALGLTIDLEDGNEPWNSGAAGEQASGTGAVYGALSGAKMAAAKTATGYNGSVVKLVMDSWAAGSQSYGPFSWSHTLMTVAPCSIGSRANCPDMVDGAFYTFFTVNNLTDVFTDEVAEIHNMDSVPVASLATNQTSMLAMQSYMTSTYNVQVADYEMSYSPNQGSALPTQAQMNQASGSVQWGMNSYQHQLLMRRDSKVTSPINFFSFVDQPYSNSINGTVMLSWTCEQYLAAGPAQLNTWTDVDRPFCITAGAGNTAIGNKTTMLTVTQGGTNPTLNYPGGQGGTIPANPSIPYVESFGWTDGAGNFALIVFNNNVSSTEAITFTGTNAPTGSVTISRIGGTVNAVGDNNTLSNIGNNGTAPVVVAPTPTTVGSLTADTLPAASMTIYTYSNSGTPTAAVPTFSPVAGTYTGSQSVTVSCSTGPVACYSLTVTPATNGATGCSTGTLVTGPILISSTSTLHAICGGTGFIDGSPATSAYTINPATTFILGTGHFSITGNVSPQ